MQELIDRNKLRNTICAACAERLQCAEIGNVCFEVACINNAQTIEAEQVRHGRWIEIEHYRVHGEEYCDCECSICCYRISRVRGYYPNYCEDCGAEMENKEEKNND